MFFGLFSRCCGFVCSKWLWYLLIILNRKLARGTLCPWARFSTRSTQQTFKRPNITETFWLRRKTSTLAKYKNKCIQTKGIQKKVNAQCESISHFIKGLIPGIPFRSTTSNHINTHYYFSNLIWWSDRGKRLRQEQSESSVIQSFLAQPWDVIRPIRSSY